MTAVGKIEPVRGQVTLADVAARFGSAKASELEQAFGHGFFVRRGGEPLTDQRPAGQRFATMVAKPDDVAISVAAALSGSEPVMAIPTEPLPQIAPWISIGRLTRSSIPLIHPSVSKLHSLVRYDGNYAIADAGSRNGTFINGAAAARYDRGAAVTLRSGDNVRVGTVVLLFVLPADLLDMLRLVVCPRT